MFCSAVPFLELLILSPGAAFHGVFRDEKLSQNVCIINRFSCHLWKRNLLLPRETGTTPTPWDRNRLTPTHQRVISPRSARRSYSDFVPVESPVEYPDLDNFRRRLILSGIFGSCFQLMIAKTVKMQRSFRKLKP